MKTEEYFKQRYSSIIPTMDEFLKAISLQPTTLLRPNKIKFKNINFLDSFQKYKAENDVSLQKAPFRLENYHFKANEKFSLGGSLEHTIGHFYSQGYSSQLAVDVLAPMEGESVLDLCAAPGGKTVLIAERMQNSGMLVANEIYRHRNIALKANLDRMGVVNCAVTSFNGLEFPLTKKFDKCLLDGPCSAEGNLFLDINPNLPFADDSEFRKGLIRTQKKLILRAFELIKPGGTLVYSTCTYAPEENELVVQHLLDETTAKLLPIEKNEETEPGITSWKGKVLHKDMILTQRIYPHKIKSGGFFIAKITK